MTRKPCLSIGKSVPGQEIEVCAKDGYVHMDEYHPEGLFETVCNWLDPDEARAVARRLLEVADEVEGERKRLGWGGT
jgi:hypothetical protein